MMHLKRYENVKNTPSTPHYAKSELPNAQVSDTTSFEKFLKFTKNFNFESIF